MKKFFLLVFMLLLGSSICIANEKGIGMEAIRKDSFENFLQLKPLQIREVQENSPAERAGIPENWYVISINGIATSNLSEYQCLKLLNNNDKIVLKISPQEISNCLNEKSIKLVNEEGFTNIVKTMSRKRGIGLGIYKYDLDLNMPLIITSVEKGSAAEAAGLNKYTLIHKINNVSTTSLSMNDCLKIINTNKNITLETSDLDGGKKKTVSLIPTPYYSSYIQGYNKLGILSKALVSFGQYNSFENLLSEYFKTYNPDYLRGNMTNKEIEDEDIQKLQEPYEKYLQNKNNIEYNKSLYDGINTFITQYKELEKWHIKTVKDILIYYGKLNNDASEKDVINYIKNSEISNKKYYLDKLEFYHNSISKWGAWAKEIYNYSIAYENKQKLQTPKITTPYFVANADFREILWGWQHSKQLQKNGIYVITSGTLAKVIQSVAGGILVTTESSSLRNPRIIYISTKRQYADGDWINDNMFIVFEGYYNYYNTLGAMNKIYKFKEVPQAEYWNRINPHKYYFVK